MGDLQPRMRAGDKDRQRVVELLGKHFGEGRLAVEEFDERVVRAHAAVYLDELPTLTADLPHEPAARPRATRRPLPVPPVVVVLLVMLLASSLVSAAIQGVPAFFIVVLLFLLLRRRRWSRRW